MIKIVPEVQEFRDIVDTVIANQVAAQAGRRSWPDYDQQAQAAGLLFESRPAGDSVGLEVWDRRDEKRWAVRTDVRRYLGKYTGRLSVVSFEGEGDTLYRHWAIDTPLNSFPAIFTQPLDTELYRPIVRWAASPHLYGEVVTKIAALHPGEQVRLDRVFEEEGHALKEMQRDLRDIHNAHHPASGLGTERIN